MRLGQGAIALILTLIAVPGVQPLGAQQEREPPPSAGWPAIAVEVDLHNARVLTSRTGSVLPARTVALGGARVAYRRAGSRWEVAARARQSTLARDLAYGDLTLAMLGEGGAVEVGYGWRRGYDLSTGLAHGDLHHLGRVGGRFRAPLIATPLALEGRFAFYLPIERSPAAGEALHGWEGETTMLVELPRLPIQALFRYRFERFRVHRTEQEVSSLQVGLAWHGRFSR